MQTILILIALCQFSLEPPATWDLTQPDQQKGGDPVSDSSSVVTSHTPTNAPTDDGAAGEVFQRRYLVMFTATYCGPCQQWKATTLKQLRDQGYHVELIEMTEPANKAKYGDNIGAYPTFVACDWTTGKWMTEPKKGKISLSTAIAMLSEDTSKPAGPLTEAGNSVVTHTSAGLYTKAADQPANYTEAQRQQDIEHLLTGPAHAGKFTREYLESLSGYELIDLHNTDHGVPTIKGQKVGRTVAQPTTRQRLPVVNTQWGTIDLETYNRPHCNCPMCQGIQALQQQYRQTSLEKPLPPAQEPTPDDVLPQVIDALQLKPQDKLADIGCGDGRILIAAVERYGCTAIGIEIDSARAELARQNVERAGLSTRIEIVTGDALQFQPEEHGVTAAVAYLYPDLLEKLRPQLEQVRVLVTPFHRVPGLEMAQRGDVWVKRQ